MGPFHTWGYFSQFGEMTIFCCQKLVPRFETSSFWPASLASLVSLCGHPTVSLWITHSVSLWNTHRGCAGRAGRPCRADSRESLSPLDLTLLPHTHPPKIATPPLRGEKPRP